MKEKKRNSKTNYKRIDSMKDKDIDYSDIGELDGEFWEKAKLVLPHPKVKVTIRLDSQIIVWFKHKGDHYQTRINAVLKSYVNAKKGKAKQH
ncbi:MAG: BrnA antitoxin family protein [Candidatus Omnitrophica bacterium]|nr:BrnA antitoxin family protein [Candidatus Omnitrophota bacterium]